MKTVEFEFDSIAQFCRRFEFELARELKERDPKIITKIITIAEEVLRAQFEGEEMAI